MSERRYIRIQTGKSSECSPAEAAAVIKDLLAKGNNISHDAALTLERSAQALEDISAGEQQAAAEQKDKKKKK